MQFLRALGPGRFVVYLLLLSMSMGFYLFSDVWLTICIQKAQADACADGDDATPCHNPNANATLPAYLRDVPQSTMLGIYVGGALGYVLSLMTTSVFFTVMSVRACATLHRDTIGRVLHAPLSWYDKTPSGRITSRFTSDLQKVDLQLMMDLDNTFQDNKKADHLQ